MSTHPPINQAGKATPAVRRRHVFFVAGFDRKRPRYYHALYRVQSRRQAAVSGLALAVSRDRSKPSPDSTAWTVEVGSGDQVVHTTVELLEWHDIVDAHWADHAWRVLLDGAATLSNWFRAGALNRMFQLFRPPVLATLLPLLILTLWMAAAAAAGTLLAWLITVGDIASPLVSITASLLTTVLLGALGVELVHRIRFTWLLRLVRFTDLQARGRVPELDQRLSRFAHRIAAVAKAGVGEGPDEILLVGHSVGANLAVSVLSRMLDLQVGQAASPSPAIAFLSLGHCMPMLGLLDSAESFRHELQHVATSTIDWLDITAPIDWAAFPQIDPVAAAGLPSQGEWHPCLRSPRFHRLFSQAGYQRLKSNRFQVHMQYLLASELPGRYDYFAITAGPQTLRERFADADDDNDQAPLASSARLADPTGAGR